MGMVSNRDRKIFTQLVRDCILYGLNEMESLEYIEKRSGGVELHRSTLYLIKKRISLHDSNTLEERLNEHIRVGFALKHFNHIAAIENIQKILFKTLADEVPRNRLLKEICLRYPSWLRAYCKISNSCAN